MNIEKQEFESLEIVKKVKKEISTFTVSNGYYHLSVYYAFLAELHCCIANDSFCFSRKIFDDFNYISNNIYQDETLKTLQKYKIGLENK